jgi:CRISPR-associated protein Cas2
MPRPGKMLYIISYDTPDNKRRYQLAKHLEAHGTRVQYSVFECELSPSAFKNLRQEIEYLVDLQEDNIRIYRLCGDCAGEIERIGVKGVFEGQENVCYIL